MTHTPAPAFAHTSGPHDANIMFVGEAFGKSEAELRLPFAGESGKELFRMLGEVWLDVDPATHAFVRSCMPQYGGNELWLREREHWFKSSSMFFTNTLAFRPPDNKMDALCSSKAEVGKDYPYAPLRQGKYLRPEYFGELDRLREEIETVKPNLIVALGAVACWALLGTPKIGAVRGTAVASAAINGHPCVKKIIPTYHPADILRNWSWRTIVLADLMKAKREALFTDVRRPERHVLVDPTLAEIEEWISRPANIYAPDIETHGGQIESISFARARNDSIVIPFIDFTKPDWSYWQHPADEALAWHYCDKIISGPVPKLFQNGLFDLQYIWKMGIVPRNCTHDTMLLHHSLFPEMPKALGFMGSIYSNESSWKLMRARKGEEFKKDE